MKESSFLIFKGLQSPLVFKNFKGKYIYWAIGLVLGTFITGTLFISLIGNVSGVLYIAFMFGGGILWISQKQKKGLSEKKQEKGIFINEAKYTFNRIEDEQ